MPGWLTEACLALNGEGSMVHIDTTSAAILVTHVQFASHKRVLAADVLAYVPRIVIVLILVRVFPGSWAAPCIGAQRYGFEMAVLPVHS